MTIWSDHIVAVFGSIIKIYSIPNVSGKQSIALVTSLSPSLRYPVMDAFFTTSEVGECLWDEKSMDVSSTLCIIIRDVSSKIRVLKLSADLSVKTKCEHLKWQSNVESFLISPKNEDVPYNLYLGSNGFAFCYCTIKSKDHSQLPKFRVGLVRLSLQSDEESTTEPAIVPTDGFPMLIDYPCIDFDDARGVVLIGNCQGELGLVHFDGGGTYKGTGVIDDQLPFNKYLESSAADNTLVNCLDTLLNNAF